MFKKIVISILLAKFIFLNSMTQEELNAQLFAEIKNKNIEEVEKLINNGANTNAKNETDWAPIHYASAIGNNKIVELLIHNNADVNVKAGTLTSLDMTLINQHLETAIILLINGANTPNKKILDILYKKPFIIYLMNNKLNCEQYIKNKQTLAGLAINCINRNRDKFRQDLKEILPQELSEKISGS